MPLGPQRTGRQPAGSYLHTAEPRRELHLSQLDRIFAPPHLSAIAPLKSAFSPRKHTAACSSTSSRTRGAGLQGPKSSRLRGLENLAAVFTHRQQRGRHFVLAAASKNTPRSNKERYSEALPSSIGVWVPTRGYTSRKNASASDVGIVTPTSQRKASFVLSPGTVCKMIGDARRWAPARLAAHCKYCFEQ